MNVKSFLIAIYFFTLFTSCQCSSNIPPPFESLKSDASMGDSSFSIEELIELDNRKEKSERGSEREPYEEQCADGALRQCYDGPKDSLYGICKKGEQICTNGAWSPCKNQILPKPEICNNLDDDCDGRIDLPSPQTPPCYTGPPKTRSIGLCRVGNSICEKGTPILCLNEKVPSPEVCDNEDNNCNGEVDEGNVCSNPIFPQKMVAIDKGRFILGSSSDKDNHVNPITESPPVPTILSKFEIDTYEVTNRSYLGCVQHGACKAPTFPELKDNPRSYPEFPRNYWSDPKFRNFPVVGITWHDAKNYCLWSGKRLPTEAQWERASKGPPNEIIWRRYPWGIKVPKDCSFSNILIFKNIESPGGKMVDSFNSCSFHPAQIGSYKIDKSLEGIYDMSGNVAEWTQDCFVRSWYGSSKSFEDPEQLSCEKGVNPLDALRVVRGGHFSDFPWNARTTSRKSRPGNQASILIGFRCVKM